jgi:hypothetical protein
VEDVFGGLSSPPPGGLQALEDRLAQGRLWGLELDPRFRVLAATVEPRAVVDLGSTVPGDRRVQLLCFPVSTILASLRRHDGDDAEVLTFTDEQLVDVVATLDGPRLEPPLFGQGEPRPGAWAPRFSLEGRSSAPDGTRRTLTVRVTADDLHLDVFARFDDVELKDATGAPLELPAEDR